MLLALPSLAVLALLILHSAWCLPARRAAAFWTGVALYGLVRGAAVRWITESGLGGSFPYVIRDPILAFGGVSLQEVAGWAIVLYLGWWVGVRLSPRLFVQVLVALVTLSAASLAVESAAIAAGWWRWTVPVPEDSWTGVPFIGIVDWLFTGTDFLLPFLALTAPALRGRRARWLALTTFPAHFGAHLLVQRPAGWFPIPVHHLVHWLLAGVVVWLALRSRAEDRPFAPARPSPGATDRPGLLRAGAGAAGPPSAGSSHHRTTSRDRKGMEARDRRLAAALHSIPAVALMIVLAVLAVADVQVARQPSLLAALLPLAAIGLGAALPFPRIIPPAARTGGAAWALAALLGAGAFIVHAAAARGEADLRTRLDEAIALRDGGKLPEAERALEAIAAEHRGSHVARAMRGEIAYRSGRLDDARRLFAAATRIQQSYADGFRYLAVIDLRRGQPAAAAAWAARGLEIEPRDPQLLYLAARAQGTVETAGGRPPRAPPPPILDRIGGLKPRQAYGLASLAFEVDDLEGASALMDAGAARWPAERLFLEGRVRMALARGEPVLALRAARQWLDAMPGDAGALAAVRSLEAPHGSPRR